MTSTARSAALLLSVGAGWLVAHLAHLTGVEESSGYRYFVTALLGIGLYASTRAIVIAEFKNEIRTVVLAVTLGVLAKAVFIFGVMYLFFRDPRYLVLGVAVAQIDPLSVAAMVAKSKMSPSAKSLLLAWASFDDPITVLLTAYFTAFALHPSVANSNAVMGVGLGSFGQNLLWNLLLAGAAYLAWLGFTALRRRVRRKIVAATHLRVLRTAAHVLVGVGVLVVCVVAVANSLLLALALIGLFFRPPLGRLIDAATQVALYLGTFAMGLVLVGGLRLTEGVVLGTAAYLSQVVVGLVVTTPRRWRGDRIRLALGQQNGLTAIILALLLEPDLPGAIAIIAPAIVVVNLLNATCNGLWDHLRPPTPKPGTRPATGAGPSVAVSSRRRAPTAAPRAEHAG